MSILTKKEQQLHANAAVSIINAAHRATGKSEVTALEGVRSCSTNCVVARTLQIRNKFDGEVLYVRSVKQAKAIAKAWGTKYEKTGTVWSRIKGFKDFKAEVWAPTALSNFVFHFDMGDLKDIETSLGKSAGRNVYRITKGRPVEMVTGVTMEVGDALRIVKAL